MKTKILVVIALLCSLQVCYATGTLGERNYKVLQEETDKTVIEVTGDCDIIVAEIAPIGKDKIYGDKVNDVQYGGDDPSRFQSNQVAPNQSVNGVKILQENNRVILRIKYAELANAEIKIKTAIRVVNTQHPGYYPGGSFCISLRNNNLGGNAETSGSIGYNAQLPGVQTYSNTTKIQDIIIELDTLKNDVAELKKIVNTFEKESFDFFPLFVALLVGLLIGYFLFKINRSDLKGLSKDYSDLKKIVATWETKNNIQVVAHQTVPQKNKGRSTMSDDDIRRFIVEQIKSLQLHNVHSINQIPITSNSVTSSVSVPAKKEEQLRDTDDVKYHQEDNSFSLEQTDIKIFRIYLKNEEYFYTIVNDSAVREELKGMLQAFEGCITYQTTGGEAKKIEPVTDGKLRKDGNKFFVDANNKLLVKFV